MAVSPSALLAARRLAICRSAELSYEVVVACARGPLVCRCCLSDGQYLLAVQYAITHPGTGCHERHGSGQSDNSRTAGGNGGGGDVQVTRLHREGICL